MWIWWVEISKEETTVKLVHDGHVGDIGKKVRVKYASVYLRSVSSSPW